MVVMFSVLAGIVPATRRALYPSISASAPQTVGQILAATLGHAPPNRSHYRSKGQRHRPTFRRPPAPGRRRLPPGRGPDQKMGPCRG
jgi:hypothetical protein